jgi:hypothetical protein
MAEVNLENRLASLEKKLASQEKLIARQEKGIYDLNATKEINDLMSKYEYLHCAGMFPEHAELFAKRDDTIAQVGDWGYYQGWESIRKCYAGLHMHGGLDGPGYLYEHYLTTSLVVVAGDGKTAKGVWMSPGNETMPAHLVPGKKRELAPGEKQKGAPGWCMVKYGTDFILMPDKHWYIWHNIVFLTFWADYNNPDGWGVSGEHRGARRDQRVPKEFGPDKPSIPWHQPYSPDTKREFMPAFPLPYETYDEKEGMGWMYPKATRRKMYPHDLEGTENLWPYKNTWK